MSCIRRFVAAIGLVKAFLSRLLFSVHGLICIWRVYVVKRDPLYWCLTITIGFLIVEAVITLRLRKGEWKWFCPSVFLFLATAIPAIWFLELDLLNQRIQHTLHGNPTVNNVTHDDVLGLEDEIKINLEPDAWVKILEQMLMLVLIIGRWLLPKGEISREQLSQLLLVYIGMAADIIELFEAFKEEAVKYNEMLIIITLALWTGSLMQFTFVVTASKSRRPRPVIILTDEPEEVETIGSKCCPVEVVSIIVSVVLQDGPFFGLRMTLIFYYNVLSYSNIFFTSKNGLVLVLQIYRLVILYTTSSTSSDSSSSCSNGSDQSEVIMYGGDVSGGDDNDGRKVEGYIPKRKKSQKQAKLTSRISRDFDSSDTTVNDIIVYQENRGPKTSLVKTKKHTKGHSKREGSYNVIMASPVDKRYKDDKPKVPKITRKPSGTSSPSKTIRSHTGEEDGVVITTAGKISRKVQCDRDNSVESGILIGTREVGVQVNRKSLERFMADI